MLIFSVPYFKGRKLFQESLLIKEKSSNFFYNQKGCIFDFFLEGCAFAAFATNFFTFIQAEIWTKSPLSHKSLSFRPYEYKWRQEKYGQILKQIYFVAIIFVTLLFLCLIAQEFSPLSFVFLILIRAYLPHYFCNLFSFRGPKSRFLEYRIFFWQKGLKEGQEHLTFDQNKPILGRRLWCTYGQLKTSINTALSLAIFLLWLSHLTYCTFLENSSYLLHPLWTRTRSTQDQIIVFILSFFELFCNKSSFEEFQFEPLAHLYFNWQLSDPFGTSPIRVWPLDFSFWFSEFTVSEFRLLLFFLFYWYLYQFVFMCLRWPSHPCFGWYGFWQRWRNEKRFFYSIRPYYKIQKNRIKYLPIILNQKYKKFHKRRKTKDDFLTSEGLNSALELKNRKLHYYYFWKKFYSRFWLYYCFHLILSAYVIFREKSNQQELAEHYEELELNLERLTCEFESDILSAFTAKMGWRLVFALAKLDNYIFPFEEWKPLRDEDIWNIDSFKNVLILDYMILVAPLKQRLELGRLRIINEDLTQELSRLDKAQKAELILVEI